MYGVISMENRIFAIIQARMDSTRLHGKVLMDLCGRPILFHIIQRMRRVKTDKIIIATSKKESDDLIAKFAQNYGVLCFRGSEEDVLDRFYQTAQSLRAGPNDVIIRLTADNPFMDPEVCTDLLTYFNKNSFTYATTSNYPLGIGVEVFTFRALEEACKSAQKPYEREHVTPFMYRTGQMYGKLCSPVNYSSIRLTVDTPEDYKVAQVIYNSLYPVKEDFGLPEIIDFLRKHPDVVAINVGVHQKQLGE